MVVLAVGARFCDQSHYRARLNVWNIHHDKKVAASGGSYCTVELHLMTTPLIGLPHYYRRNKNSVSQFDDDDETFILVSKKILVHYSTNWGH